MALGARDAQLCAHKAPRAAELCALFVAVHARARPRQAPKSYKAAANLNHSLGSPRMATC